MMELKKRRNAYLMFLLLCLVAAAAIAGMSALLYQSNTSEQGMAEENENAGSDGEEIAEGGNAGNGSGTAANTGTDETGGDDVKTANGSNTADSSENTAKGSDTADDGEKTANGGSTADDGVSTANGSAADKNATAADGSDDADAEGAGGGNASNMADATDSAEGGDSLAAAGQVTESLLAEKISAYSFDAEKIAWPVEGEVCLEYNMEHTIYYSTLDLYRCNPGVCIRSEAGTSVLAGADGVVTGVAEDSFYGTMVTVALGSGYVATYGQLADVDVTVGDEVSASTQIGTVAEPTIYFTEEGAHLFFEVTKNGETVDPLDYLNY